eukprot:485098_1
MEHCNKLKLQKNSNVAMILWMFIFITFATCCAIMIFIFKSGKQADIYLIYPTSINSTGHYYFSNQTGDFVNGHIFCNTTTSCNIFCDHYSACQNTSIQCLYGNCHIHCNAFESCQHIAISVYHSDSVTLSCRNYSCESSLVIIEQSNFISLDCTGKQACSDVTLYTCKSIEVFVHCDGDYSCSSSLLHIGCTNFSTPVLNPSYALITCTGNYACAEAKLFSFRQNSSLICGTKSNIEIFACLEMYVFVDGRNQFVNTNVSCFQNFGCQNMQLHINGKNNESQSSLLCNGQANSSGEDCTNVYFYCYQNNKCFVNCVSGTEHSCKNSILYCDDGINETCISNDPVHFTPTPTQTSMPTSITTFPTNYPTITPTRNPTHTFIEQCEVIILNLTITSNNNSLYYLISVNKTKFGNIIKNNINNYYFSDSNEINTVFNSLEQENNNSLRVSFDVRNCDLNVRTLKKYFISNKFNRTMNDDINDGYYNGYNDGATITAVSTKTISYLPPPINFSLFSVNNPLTIVLLSIIAIFIMIVFTAFCQNKNPENCSKCCCVMTDNFKPSRVVFFIVAVFTSFNNLNTSYAYFYGYTFQN